MARHYRRNPQSQRFVPQQHSHQSRSGLSLRLGHRPQSGLRLQHRPHFRHAPDPADLRLPGRSAAAHEPGPDHQAFGLLRRPDPPRRHARRLPPGRGDRRLKLQLLHPRLARRIVVQRSARHA